MKVASFYSRFPAGIFRQLVTIVSALALLPGDCTLIARQSSQQSSTPAEEQTARIPSEQLDSLVAPIALYPDPLLSQTLVASTYPLEIIQLQQWLEKNKNLKDKALGGCREEAGLGSKHSGHGSTSGCGQTNGR